MPKQSTCQGKPATEVPPLLEARGIVKRFGALLANDVGHFSVGAGEVVALLGENGAGKSTLCKILYGYYRPDAGELRISGAPVSIASPRDARRLGVGMVFQNFSLIPALSVWENVALFLEDLPWAIDPEQIRRRMTPLAERLRLNVDFGLPAGRLAVGDQQKVEILKQLLAGARVLILDEPSKVLAPQEAERLFDVLLELSDDGYGLVLITHKLREAMACASRIVVMRSGRIVGEIPVADAAETALLDLMFGEPWAARAAGPERDDAAASGAAALTLDGISTAPSAGAVALRDLSLRLDGGEILGVAGVSGNGQRELADLALGLLRPIRGSKRLWGEVATNWSAARVRESGVASIPDDPAALALVPGLTVRENLSLGAGRRYRKGLGVDWARLSREMTRSAARLRLPPPPFDSLAGVLSGGNQQRVVLTRELAHDPKLIVALYPTRGLDARSAEALRAAFVAARAAGAAILLVSEDLEELFALSDRLVVLRDGRIAGAFAAGSYRLDAVGACMTGRADAA
jgi:simple sugar transport system ATP-binding protein